MGFSSEEVDLLLQIARDASLGRNFAERIEAIADAISALIPNTSMDSFVVDPASGQGPPEAHLIFRNRDVAYLREYAMHYMKADPMAVSFPWADGVPRTMSDFLPSSRYGKDEFSSVFLPRIGVQHVIAVSHKMPGGALLSFALHREKGLKDFTTREREIMRLASPDIARATFSALVSEKVAALASGSTDDPQATSGAILFDALGDVVHADPGGLTIARRLDHNGRFPAEELVEEARSVARRQIGGLAVERLLALRGGGFVLARFSPMKTGPSWGAVCVLEILRTGSRAHFDAVADRAHLTPRERDVAALTIQGLGNRQIARRLELSEITVAYHLGKIYSKTNVENRTELATLLLGGPPTA